MSNATITSAPSTPSLAHVDLPIGVHKLFAMRGSFVRLVLERTMKVRKGKEEIVKHSECTVRVNCEYENLSTVKEMREEGKEKGEMAWGNWLVYPILKEHKGNYYIRCAAVNGNEHCVPKVSFFRNGVEIDREIAKADCLASEFYEKDLIVFDVKISNVVSINGENI
jgi:hypothetical protein